MAQKDAENIQELVHRCWQRRDTDTAATPGSNRPAACGPRDISYKAKLNCGQIPSLNTAVMSQTSTPILSEPRDTASQEVRKQVSGCFSITYTPSFH